MTSSHETTAAAPRNSANWSAPAPTLRPTLRPKRQEMNDWDSTIRATFADTQALDLHRPAAPEQFLCDCLLSQEFLQAALDVGDSLAAKPDAAAGNDDGGSGDAGFLKWVTDRTALRRRETTDLRAVLGRGWGDCPV